MIKAVVFDCDGVLVDSEIINNAVFAELVTRAGLPTTLAQSIERYMGRATVECVADVERELGRPVGFDLPAEYEREVLARQRDGLTAVDGVRELLELLRDAAVPVCVASSGTPQEIAFRLRVTGLAEYFGEHCYSAAMVARGKPEPDLFLLAADRIGVDPADCALIEDSPFGVRGGRAAGMTVLGYAALASADTLRAAGAAHVVTAMAQVPPLLGLTAA
ncbi:HAD family hydrolase [Catellatospora citrea]|uniref:Haloacid dehalogenase n=1 Tax=Catellatospora citrea TaxID=53366 RepID=A0A8J3KFG0_9ACTN|nr:HAD family phosphatase [Catellatospora citrea]RKE06779.1 HAD superfamily hydrolase (TIGR01509 family) [Catellatospora citrea]GIF94924.1 haloacid dehalogenase [Catellatospora citrea]